MKSSVNPSMDAFILCGGEGRRLRSLVTDRPKPMANINQKPFLDLLISNLPEKSIKRLFLLTGYMGEKIAEYYSERNFNQGPIKIVQESHPLGTGGAFFHALPLSQAQTILVMNGDTYCPINLEEFLSFHLEKNAAITIALVSVDDRSRFGTVDFSNDGKIIRFVEKEVPAQKEGQGYVSAGIYLINREKMLENKYPEVCSLEHDIFPRFVNNGLYAYPVKKAAFTDIGTPESYMAFCKEQSI